LTDITPSTLAFNPRVERNEKSVIFHFNPNGGSVFRRREFHPAAFHLARADNHAFDQNRLFGVFAGFFIALRAKLVLPRRLPRRVSFFRPRRISMFCRPPTVFSLSFLV
jgi:hypothetical protein